MKIITIADIKLQANEDYTLPTAEVAKFYGVGAKTIREHKKNHSDELIENKHFVFILDERNRKRLYWTLEGVYMLGFFIKSERAKKYRKAVAKLLKEIKSGNVEVKPAQQNLLGETDDKFVEELVKRTDIVRGYQGQIARLENELAKKQSQLKNYERLLEGDADLYFQALEHFITKIDVMQEELEGIKAILTSKPEKHNGYTTWGKGCFPQVKYPRNRLKRIL